MVTNLEKGLQPHYHHPLGPGHGIYMDIPDTVYAIPKLFDILALRWPWAAIHVVFVLGTTFGGRMSPWKEQCNAWYMQVYTVYIYTPFEDTL